MEEINVRKVTTDEGLFVYFVGLKDLWKMMMMMMMMTMMMMTTEVMLLVVVMVVMIVWNTKIYGSLEAETWRQKAWLSCRVVIS
jgi:hypothetical protein